MAAQQKPKKDANRGQRNGDRRNGKAWSKGHKNTGWNLQNEDKNRKGFYGVSLRTIEARAKASGCTTAEIILDLRGAHEKKKAYRQEVPPAVRRERARQIEIRNLRQKLYPEGKVPPVVVNTKAASGSLPASK